MRLLRDSKEVTLKVLERNNTLCLCGMFTGMFMWDLICSDVSWLRSDVEFHWGVFLELGSDLTCRCVIGVLLMISIGYLIS